MTIIIHRKKVALIGSGRFIEQTVLPSFLALEEYFDVCQIVNRSGTLSTAIKKLAPLSAASQLDKLSPTIDIIVISVPQRAVKTILKSLTKQHIQGKILLFTTPVAPINALFTLRALAKTNELFSFEFLPFHPKYRVLKQHLKEQSINAVRKISLIKSGYLYHGLATLRFLTNYKPINSSRLLTKVNKQSFTFALNDQTIVEMIGPKDYTKGYIMVEANTLTFTDNPNAIPANDIVIFSPCLDSNGLISGYQFSSGEQYLLDSQLIRSELANIDKEQYPLYQQEFLIAATHYLMCLAKGEYQSLHKVDDTLYEHWLIRLTRLFKSLNTHTAIESLLKLFRFFTR